MKRLVRVIITAIFILAARAVAQDIGWSRRLLLACEVARESILLVIVTIGHVYRGIKQAIVVLHKGCLAVIPCCASVTALSGGVAVTNIDDIRGVLVAVVGDVSAASVGSDQDVFAGANGVGRLDGDLALNSYWERGNSISLWLTSG